jgi:dienelactone hydrolase
VFFGVQHLQPENAPPETALTGASVVFGPWPPVPTRVFFPSLDGTPSSARPLQGCGRFPLVLMVHGDCHPDRVQYLKWYVLPAQLARAGYVVAVPQLANIALHPSANTQVQGVLVQTLRWMREAWQYASMLLPPPATGVIGHSFGGLHAGILATRSDVQISAVAYLGAVWIDWPDAQPRPITLLHAPQLFMWGTNEIFSALPNNLWQAVPTPKHRAVFPKGEHWDYLYDQDTPCDATRGPCSLVPAAARDLATMFFGRYLPPELVPDLGQRVPASLVPPALNLTVEQQFYAGSYLSAFPAIQQTSDCGVQLTHALPTDRTVPYVQYLPRNGARQEVLEADLTPVFIGSSSGAAWVLSQSPAAGKAVQAGATVTMRLRTGSMPESIAS